LASSGDVGTIRLERAARICCLVVDQAGTPIQGALILGESVSEPTDQAGRTTVLAADRGQRRFLAGAVRYRIDEVQVQAGSGTEQRPFLLRLPPGNVLRIRVRDPKGAVPTGLRVLVSTSTKGPLFTGSKGGRHTRLHFCLGTRYSSAQLGSSKKPRLVYQYYLEPSARGKGEPGEIVLVSLVESPGLVVRVIDRLDQEVAVRHLDSLGISGCKNLAINLERELVAISGRVVDPKGNPLSSRVAFRSSSADTRGRVHCKGRFQLPRVYPTGARYSIVATSPGYVRSTIDVVLQPSIEPLEFRIVPGRDVRVELVDRNRNRVPAACQVDVAGYDRFACVETGVWRFPGLPLGVVTFSTRIGHRRFEMQHDTRTGDARFLLPVPGRCVMEANALLRPKDVDLVTFQVRHTGSGDIAAELQLRGRHARKNLLQTEAFLLLPGRYTAEFGSGRGASFQALTEAKPLTIKAGELSRCRWMDAPRRLPSK
jgi:hypothetical protein